MIKVNTIGDFAHNIQYEFDNGYIVSLFLDKSNKGLAEVAIIDKDSKFVDPITFDVPRENEDYLIYYQDSKQVLNILNRVAKL